MLKKEILKEIDESIENKELIKSLLLDTLVFKLEDNIINKPSMSKIGGKPYFTSEIKYPYYNNQPLPFLAQISLDQIKKYNTILPETGIIYFFVNTDIEDVTKEFKVLFSENNQTQNIYAMPTDVKVIDEYYVSFFESYTFPSYQESIVEDMGVNDQDQNIVEEIIVEYLFNEYKYDAPHHILGHPQAVQGTVRFWWALQYLGFEEKSQYSEEEMRQIKKEENNFILLLQLSLPDPKINFSKYIDDELYFGIHKDDLKNKNFDNVILVSQFT